MKCAYPSLKTTREQFTAADVNSNMLIEIEGKIEAIDEDKKRDGGMLPRLLANLKSGAGKWPGKRVLESLNLKHMKQEICYQAICCHQSCYSLGSSIGSTRGVALPFRMKVDGECGIWNIQNAALRAPWRNSSAAGYLAVTNS